MNGRILKGLMVIAAVLLLSGCASKGLLYSQKQENIVLKAGQGGVLLVFDVGSHERLRVNQLTIQELDQYRSYKKLKTINVKTGGTDDSSGKAYVALQAPEGRYLIKFANVTLGKGMMARNAGLSINKVVDVHAGALTYGGHLEVSYGWNGNAIATRSVVVQERMAEDLGLFYSYFPVLRGAPVALDLVY